MRTPPKPRLRVYYDETCGPCTSIASLLDRLNWLGWVRFQKAATYPEGDGLEYEDMHSIRADQTVYRGYASYQEIARRIPLLWLVAPWLYLPPIPWIGRRIYRRIADGRRCETP